MASEPVDGPGLSDSNARDDAGPRQVQADEQLLEERRFLIDSLDEITDQAQSGLIDQSDFERIRRNYNARIAAVQAQIDGEQIAQTQARSRKILVTWVVLGLAVVVASWMLSQSLGKRLPGQTMSGNSVADREPAPVQTRDDLVAATEAAPDDPNAWMDLARFDMTSQNLPNAVQEFDKAADLDRDNPEPSAYGGWVLWLAANGQQGEQFDTLTTGALRRLEDALRRDPGYPDALAFRGILLYRGLGDSERAIPSLQQYLASTPQGPMSAQVRALLEEAVTARSAGVGQQNPGPSGAAGGSTTTSSSP
jgi:cytochrome c-type biogenesis protein CcmH/NrfG